MSRLETFREKATQHPDNELFQFSYAQALIDASELEASVKPLEFCVSKKPDWMMAKIMLGKTLLALDRADEAKPVLEEALQLAIDQKHEDPEEEVRHILDTLANRSNE